MKFERAEMRRGKRPGNLKKKNPRFEEEKDKLFWDLSHEQRKSLHKFNPYRRERDQLIAHLYRRGVKLRILADLSKMSKSSVHRAAHRTSA
jgi:hypothetical protein